METFGMMAGLFGGLSLFFWTLAKMLPEMKRAGLLQSPPPKPVRVWQIHMPFFDAQQVQVNPPPAAPRSESFHSDSVLEEVRALRLQMEQMQSTCHQVDLSFDAALNRLEERVQRVEMKQMSASADEAQRVRLG
ncbi:MAG: hypothetical protein ACRYFS_11065 [Janthinobacterium lividum]